jgi:hypothetical protein
MSIQHAEKGKRPVSAAISLVAEVCCARAMVPACFPAGPHPTWLLCRPRSLPCAGSAWMDRSPTSL